MTEVEHSAPPRRRLTALERRHRIEDAAVAAFAERGYDATTLGEIAAEAGVARTVLYDHFRDKRTLYLHVLSTENAAMLRRVVEGITGTGAGRERMRATVAAYLDHARERPAGRSLLVDPVPAGDAELDQVICGYRDARAQAVTALLAPDLARAGIALDSPAVPVVVELLIAGVDGVARWCAAHPEVDHDEAVDAAVRLLWQGLPRFGD